MPKPGGVTDALAEIWSALGGPAELVQRIFFVGDGSLPAAFAVTDLAAASVAAATVAVAELMHTRAGALPEVTVDRRLAAFWFARSIRPRGWAMAAPWDAIAGDYAAADGWIRLHTNAPHHRAAALQVLDVPALPDQVARAVSFWQAGALEAAIVANGGCAAAMHTMAAWAAHPQGRAVAAEPLLIRKPGGPGPTLRWHVPPGRPLQGVRVLDMTRVLAGPVATRFLAGFGAEVLRIDPPEWDEPGVVPDVALGKSCARLDLRRPGDRTVWKGLLRQADVLVHGYRPGALAGLGLDADHRSALRPGLVEVSLDAYGWSGPWRERRGFDSLVQMSSGIAEAGMRQFARDRPTPLPVQALDHATGYVMAAAVVRGLTERRMTGAGVTVQTSLARTAALLTSLAPDGSKPLAPEMPDDIMDHVEMTSWGPAFRIRPPCSIAGAPMLWNAPATALGSAAASWAG